MGSFLPDEELKLPIWLPICLDCLGHGSNIENSPTPPTPPPLIGIRVPGVGSEYISPPVHHHSHSLDCNCCLNTANQNSFVFMNPKCQLLQNGYIKWSVIQILCCCCWSNWNCRSLPKMNVDWIDPHEAMKFGGATSRYNVSSVDTRSMQWSVGYFLTANLQSHMPSGILASPNPNTHNNWAQGLYRDGAAEVNDDARPLSTCWN